MAAIGSFGTSPQLRPVKSPANLTFITSAIPSTETSFTVALVKRFKITNRGTVNIQYSYISGDSGTNYVSITPNASSEEVGIDDQTITIYIQAPSASQRLEVVTWS